MEGDCHCRQGIRNTVERNMIAMAHMTSELSCYHTCSEAHMRLTLCCITVRGATYTSFQHESNPLLQCSLTIIIRPSSNAGFSSWPSNDKGANNDRAPNSPSLLLLPPIATIDVAATLTVFPPPPLRFDLCAREYNVA